MIVGSAPKILNFIRHAPSKPSSYLYGQTDADIGVIDRSVCDGLRALIGPAGLVLSSPARRCQKTCDSVLSPSCERLVEPALWEQSFGAWDGLSFAALPDIGTLQDDALVAFAAPDGESFSDLCARVHPLITNLCQTSHEEVLTFFGHAGVIRAALALAFGKKAAAMRCEIDNLSLTRLRYLGDDGFSVMIVNQTVSS